jgi:hypothetical protein
LFPLLPNPPSLKFKIEMATSVLQRKIDLYGPDSEKLVDILVFMAECYRSVAAYDEAEGFVQQVLE